MTQPSLPPLVDAGNTHLNTDLVADLTLGKIPVPGGETGVVTIRQGNTTLTVTLDRAGTEQWIGLLGQLRDKLSGSGKIVVANNGGIVAASNGMRQ
jgi:hypothetical protein